MKDLELIVHPKRLVDTGFHRITPDGGWLPVLTEQWFIDGQWTSHLPAIDKRFTDAELAAEFEAARCDAMMAQESGTFWAPLGETWPDDYASASERCSTLLRIATAEHYDETP